MGRRSGLESLLATVGLLLSASVSRSFGAVYLDPQLTADCSGNYSVAQRACSGSDGAAYHTLAGSYAGRQPGDTVYLRGGTYSETLQPSVSGTWTQPIVYAAYGSETVNLAGVNLDSVNDVRLQGLRASSLSQWGITWTFDANYSFGRFANGDYWVLGPVTINSMTPAYTGSQNGWEVNPASFVNQGFDSRAPDFLASLVPSLPYTAAPGASVVKGISLGTGDKTFLRTAAVLTVLGSAPPNFGADVFRLPYFGTSKPAFVPIANLQTQKLPSLAPTANAPSLAATLRDFQRVQLEHKSDWTGDQIHPTDNGPDYGAAIATRNNEGALRLMLNDPVSAKMDALIAYVQYGLDVAAMIANGGHYPANGGHDQGKELVLSFAAVLLNDQSMKDLVTTSGQTTFSENESIYFSAVAGRPLYGQTSGGFCSEQVYWNDVTGNLQAKTCRDPYGYIDGGLRPGQGYQGCCVSAPSKGAALAVDLFTDMQGVWNNNGGYLQYADRYVNLGAWTQGDACAPADGVCTGGSNPGAVCTTATEDATGANSACTGGGTCALSMANYGKTFGPDGKGGCIKGSGRFPLYHGSGRDAGYYSSPFVDAMWTQYRNLPAGSPPAITSPSSANGTVGSAFSYQIAASNSPTSYNATGLPAGLSVNTSNGLISGTPGAAGSSSVSLSATNAAGTGSASLTLSIAVAVDTIPPSVAIISPVNGTSVSGTFAVSGTAFDNVAVSSVGVSLDGGAYSVASGTSNWSLSLNSLSLANGSHTLQAKAWDNSGNASISGSISLTVSNSVPVITSAGSASGTAGSAFSYQITASNSPTSFGASGLPAGLSVNASNGLISGTPSAAGSFSVNVSASNAAGTGSATLALTISGSGVNCTTGVWNNLEACGWPGPASTGPDLSQCPGGVLTVNSGATTRTITISAPNTVISCQNITGSLQITAQNVTIKNSIITYDGGGADATGVININDGASATIDHVELNGLNHTHACIWDEGVKGVVAYSMVAKNVNCHGTNDGIWSWWWPSDQNAGAGSDFIIQDSYLHDFTEKASNGHIDGYQTEGAQNGTITHNTFLMTDVDGGTANSAISIWDDYNQGSSPTGLSAGNITVSNNLIAGGGFANYAEDYSGPSGIAAENVANSAVGGDSLVKVSFLNNKYSTRLYPCVGTYGVWFYRGSWPPYYGGPTDSWNKGGSLRSGNVVLETGENIDTGGPNGCEGHNTSAAPPSSGAPAVTSAGSASGTVGSAFSYQITASNSPTSFSATGLPAGLSINTASGLISGTPGAAGTSNVALSASNASGTGSATLTLTIAADTIPPSVAIVSPLNGANVSGTFAVSGTASDDVAVSSVGVSLDGGAYSVASGTSNWSFSLSTLSLANGSHALRAKAWDGSGNVSTSALVSVMVSNPVPVITSASSASGTVGSAFSYQITASNNPASFNATGLPAGLSINISNGLISGTPSAAGTSSVSLSAANASGTGSATLALTINSPVPAWSNAAFASQSGSFTASFDAVPSLANEDAVVALSSAAAAAFTDLAVIARFNSAGNIDARNGGAYAALSTVTYSAGASYHFRLVVNVPAHAYDIYVTPQGQPEVLLGQAYAFRTEQAGVTFLANQAKYAASGDAAISNFAVSAASAAPPSVALTSPADGATVSGTISIDASVSASAASVTFFIDGSSQGVVAAPPYSFSWDTTLFPDGSHVLAAVASDAAGNGANSAPITVNVSNAVGTLSVVGATPGAGLAAVTAAPAYDPAGLMSQVLVELRVDARRFPPQPSLQLRLPLPSGVKAVTLYPQAADPALYAAQVSGALFVSQDFAALETSRFSVAIGTRTYAIQGQFGRIEPLLGGVITETSGGGASVIVPAGSVTQSAKININPLPSDAGGRRGSAMARQNLQSLGAGRDIVMVSSGSLKQATLTLPIDPSLLPKGLTLSQARIAYFNAATGVWEVQPNARLVGNALQTDVVHFSPYQPVILVPSSAAGLRNSYVYPNPAVAPNEPTIRASLGVVDSVEVTIFDVSGRQVHGGSVSGAPTGIAGGEYYYDYTWSGSKASGAYFAVIHGKKADGTTVRARTKFIVVR